MTKTPFNNDNTSAGVEGWYAIDNDTLIIYFKPTNSKRDWKNHLKCWPKKIVDRTYVHPGWYNDVASVYRIVQDIIALHPGKPVILAGYSYGAAVAKCYGRMLKTPPRAVISIAGPKYYASRVYIPSTVIHIRNRCDIVPFLPPFYRGAQGEKDLTRITGRERPFWKAHDDYDVDKIIAEVREKYLKIV